MTKSRALTLLLCCVLGTASSAEAPITTRGILDLDCRLPHCDPNAPEKDVEAGEHELVDSGVSGGGEDSDPRSGLVCRPDSEGFVGAETGQSYLVPYAFGLETEQDSDIVEVLTGAKASVEELLIGHFLPEACEEVEVRRKLQGVVGFRFDTEMDLISVACQPLVRDDANCAIYEGIVLVYGENGGVLSLIEDHFNHEDARDIHPKILRVFSSQNSEPTMDVDVLDEVTPEPQGATFTFAPAPAPSSSGGLSSGAVAGIVVSILALVIGIAGFVYFQRRRRRRTVNHGDASSINSKIYMMEDELNSVATFDGRPPIYVRKDDD